MLQKIWNITRKDLYTTFTDSSLLMLMFAAPLAIATIIGVTFGSAGQSGGAPVTDVPVAVVNLDVGIETGGTTQNNGQIIVDALVAPDAVAASTADTEAERSPEAVACNYTPRKADAAFENPLWKLIHAVQFDDPVQARACVDQNVFAAAIIIPADFSANLTYGPTNTSLQPTEIEIYNHPSRPISVSIVRSVVEGISNQIVTVNVAIAAVIDRYIADNPLNFTRIGQITSSEAFSTGIQNMTVNGSPLLNIERQTTTGEQVAFNPLVLIGASQAIFFALFTANGGATSIIEERRNWTLQRLLMTPTTQINIVLGKMLGIFAMVLVQLLFLFIGFTLVGSLIAGEFQFIWGTNLPAIALVLLTSSLAVTGLGSITAAAARTPDQAGTIGAIVSLGSAMLGGAFGFNLGAPFSYLSVVYWGADAFSKLATGQNNIGLHALVLTGVGVLTFGIGLYIFNRRLEDQ